MRERERACAGVCVCVGGRACVCMRVCVWECKSLLSSSKYIAIERLSSFPSTRSPLCVREREKVRVWVWGVGVGRCVRVFEFGCVFVCVCVCVCARASNLHQNR